VEVHARKDDIMSDQTKNAQPSPAEKMPKNAGGVDDIEEREDRVEVEEGIEYNDPRRAGGGRQSESDEPSSPDSRSGSERKS
jgi:hypothetical protein